MTRENSAAGGRRDGVKRIPARRQRKRSANAPPKSKPRAFYTRTAVGGMPLFSPLPFHTLTARFPANYKLLRCMAIPPCPKSIAWPKLLVKEFSAFRVVGGEIGRVHHHVGRAIAGRWEVRPNQDAVVSGIDNEKAGIQDSSKATFLRPMIVLSLYLDRPRYVASLYMPSKHSFS